MTQEDRDLLDEYTQDLVARASAGLCRDAAKSLRRAADKFEELALQHTTRDDVEQALAQAATRAEYALYPGGRDA